MKISTLPHHLIALLILSLMLLPRIGKAQDSLQAYIQVGLQNNLIVQQKSQDIEKARLALNSAKSLFLPSVNFNGLVSHAQGGRYASLPLGDMLNPVYSTLNQLTSSNSFPTISNQNINFLPQKYYDAYVRTSLPIYNPAIRINKSIAQSQLSIKDLEMDLYKRELVLQIKNAFYDIQRVNMALNIYRQAVKLLEKNLQVNQSLYNNGKALQANVLRAQSELEKVKADLQSSEMDLNNAKAYFNFLLNRPLVTSVHLLGEKDIESLIYDLQDSGNIQNREELQMLKAGADIQNALLKLNQAGKLPTVGAYVDLGAQAVNFEVSKKAPYYMIGLTVAVPIYNGSRNNIKINQSQLDCKVNQLQTEQTENALELSQTISLNALKTSEQKLEAEFLALKSAEAYYNLIEKGYKEGIYSQIEYLDARTQLTDAQMRKNLAIFNVLKNRAELERQNATYKF